MRFTPRPESTPPTGPEEGEAGQTTAEYALVLLAAATIAMLVVAWAGTGAIGDFFDRILDEVERVALLVGGRPVETLNGHIDLRRPMRANRRLILQG